jgi:hypothetical protein
MNATMIEPRCLIRSAIDSRDSFQADFAAQGNGFVGTRTFKAATRQAALASHALAPIGRHLTSPQIPDSPADFLKSWRRTARATLYIGARFCGSIPRGGEGGN